MGQHEHDPDPRLAETLVDRQIDTVLAIDRHQVVRRSNQHVPNCVSHVRASVLTLPALLRFGDGHLEPLGTNAASRNNFGKSPFVDHARHLERSKLKTDFSLLSLRPSVADFGFLSSR